MIITTIKNLFLMKKKGEITWEYIVAIVLAVIVIGLIILLVLKSKNGFSTVGEEVGGFLS